MNDSYKKKKERILPYECIPHKRHSYIARDQNQQSLPSSSLCPEECWQGTNLDGLCRAHEDGEGHSRYHAK